MAKQNNLIDVVYCQFEKTFLCSVEDERKKNEVTQAIIV